MPAKAESEDDFLLRSFKVRWNLLVRTARTDLELLAEVDLGRDKVLTSPLKESDLSCILAGLADMVIDMQDILAKRKAMKKLSVLVPDGELLSAGEFASTGPVTPDIPISSLELRLQTAERALASIDTEIASLTKKTPAKTHRTLLESREIHTSVASSVRSQILHINEHNHDPSTVAETEELYAALVQILTIYKSKKADLMVYLKNTLIHSVILALFSTSLGLDSSDQSLSRIVIRFLDLIDVSFSQTADSTKTEEREIGLLMVEIFRSAAIERLSTQIQKLLDKKTRKRLSLVYDGRHDADTPLPTTSTAKRKVQQTTKGKKAMMEKRYNEIEYWLLTRPRVSDGELLTDSFAFSPPTSTERERYPSNNAQSEAPRETDPDHGETDKSSNTEAKTDGPANSDPVGAVKSVRLPDIDSDLHSAAGLVKLPLIGSDSTTAALDEANEDGLDLPDAPSNVLATNDTSDKDDDEPGEVDEAEVDRLVTLFASSPNSSDAETESEDSEEEEEDKEMTELQKMTPAEQEEVLRALAAARENYLSSTGDAADRAPEWEGDQTVDDLLRHAKDELKRFGASATHDDNEGDENDNDERNADD